MNNILSSLLDLGGRSEGYFTLVPAASLGPVRTLGPAQQVRLPARIKQRYQSSSYMRAGVPLRLPTKEAPIWQQKGWAKRGNEYRGSFTAQAQSWTGIITVPFSGMYKAYIQNPPTYKLADTMYQHCFSGSSDYPGYDSIHFHYTPRTLEHAIATVENVLHYAMTGVRI